MMVPLLDLSAQHEPIRKDLLAAIERVIDKNSYILGEEVKLLEENVAGYCQSRFGIGVSSGTDALLISLMALGIGSDDEVITTPLSFFSTAGCMTRLGAKPKFVDIDPGTLNLDPEKIKPAITSKTRAILPVHLYGQCADMDPKYLQYGYWKVRIIQKHKMAASVRHFIPGCFVFLLIMLPLASFFWNPLIWGFLGLVGAYSVCNISASVVTAAKDKWKLFPVVPIIWTGGALF